MPFTTSESLLKVPAAIPYASPESRPPRKMKVTIPCMNGE